MRISTINNNQPDFRGLDPGRVLARAVNINSWQQRAVLGIAAMTMQPCIDLMNKEVDEETRKVSAVRSIAKGFVGAATGILVRGGCMKAAECVLKKEGAAQKLASITAKEKTQEAIENSLHFIKEGGGAKKYASVIGTIAALGVMIVTNFAVDAPLTNWVTNKLDEKFNANKDDKPEGSGGITNGL